MFGLGLSRWLPAPARHLFQDFVQRAREHRRLPSPFAAGRERRTFAGREVVVAGLFSTRSGLGRGARLFVEDFRARGIPVHAVDLSGAMRLPIDVASDGALTPEAVKAVPATDLIIVANPPLFQEAVLEFDAGWLQDRCVVAHWVWELDQLPAFWARSAAACDEIWAPSSFVADAVRSSLPDFSGPVRTVPYPVDRDPVEPASEHVRAAVRRKLGFGTETFCIGYSFSAASNYTRKNPEAAVAAFSQAFPPSEQRVRLVIRALDLSSFPAGEARLRTMAQADPRVTLFDGVERTLSLQEFYAATDLYLAPYRAEGYGLNIVEASQAGKAVLATGWGLDQEIAHRARVEALPYRLVPVVDPQGHYSRCTGAQWADPDIEAIVQRLRDHASGALRRTA